jgi:hypothetical protein
MKGADFVILEQCLGTAVLSFSNSYMCSSYLCVFCSCFVMNFFLSSFFSSTGIYTSSFIERTDKLKGGYDEVNKVGVVTRTLMVIRILHFLCLDFIVIDVWILNLLDFYRNSALANQPYFSVLHFLLYVQWKSFSLISSSLHIPSCSCCACSVFCISLWKKLIFCTFWISTSIYF